MKITSTNLEQLVVTSSEQNQNQESYEKGEVLQGVISSVSDMVSISFSDREVTVPRSTVPNAKEGDIKEFQIMDVSNKSIVLKEVGSSTENKSKGIYCTKVDSDRTIFLAKDQKEKQDLTKISGEMKKQLNQISQTVTGKDIEEISSQEGNLSEYDVDQIEKTIERVKERRKFDKEHLESQIEKKAVQREKVEDVSKEVIEEKLKEFNIPLTEANIQKISVAVEQSQSIPALGESSVANLIRNEQSFTISNIYKASYSGQVSQHSEITPEAFASIQSKVEEIITNAGMEISEAVMDQAKWLLNQELPITEQTLLQLGQLEELKANYSPSDILEQIVAGMQEGKDPEAVTLGQHYLEDAMQIVKDIAGITKEAVNEVVGQDKPLTIKNLLQADVNGSVVTDDIKALTAHRQLEELRLQMTVENAYKLIKQGISVDTCELQEVIEQLKGLEDSYYKGLLEEQKVDQTDANISALKDSIEAYQGLMYAPCVILGESLFNKDEMTMAALYGDGKKATDTFHTMNERYETLMTKPRQDMGDSIQKAFRNIDDILNQQSIELTEDNRRAVRILAHNQMEISSEMVDRMKAYDAKVNYMLEHMNPTTVVKLIKEHMNPMEMTIDELNKQLDSMNEDLLLTDQKYSEYLYNLDKNKDLTAEERDSYIGIYRLLHQVKKSDGAVIGSVVNAGQELSLNNLLTASRVRNGSGINESVDQAFAGKVSALSQSISGQIEAGFQNTDKVAYQEYALADVLEKVDASILSKINEDCVKDNKDIHDLTIEQLKDQIKLYEKEDQGYSTQQLESLNQTIKEAKSEEIEALISCDINVSIENLENMSQLLGNSKRPYQQLPKYLDESMKEEYDGIIQECSESFVDQDSMQKQISKLEEFATHSLNEILLSGNTAYTSLEEMKRVNSQIHFQGKMSRNEYFEVPFKTGDEIATVRVSFIHGSKESGKIQLKADLDFLGSVSIDASVKNGKVKALVLCDNQPAVDRLSEEKRLMIDELEACNLEVDYIEYNLEQAVRNKKMEFNTLEQSEKVDTAVLYNVAKVFLGTIKSIEQ